MKITQFAMAVTAAATLALGACGGGGSSSTSADTGGNVVGTQARSASSSPVTTVQPVVVPVVTQTSTVTVASANGTRTFTVPLATPVGSAQDTLPSSITGEASLALWPMVASIGSYKDVAGKLTADQFPAGIWPIKLQHTSKSGNDRSDPTLGSSSSNFACSLDLISGALVAIVEGRTLSSPIDDLPAYTTRSFGVPSTGDGYRSLVSQSSDGRSTKRYLELLVEAASPYVDPKYGPANAGPSMRLNAAYEGFIAGVPAGITKLNIYSVDQKTGFYTAYICSDQLI